MGLEYFDLDRKWGRYFPETFHFIEDGFALRFAAFHSIRAGGRYVREVFRPIQAGFHSMRAELFSVRKFFTNPFVTYLLLVS